MLRRRLQMAGNGGVPEWRQHLQPCEYIKGDGNSYIDTKVISDLLTDIEVIADLTDVNDGYLIGARKGGTEHLALYVTGGTEIIWLPWNGISSGNLKHFDYSNKINAQISKSPKKCSVNNVELTYTNSIPNNNHSLLIFKDTNTAAGNYFKGGIQQVNTNLYKMLSCYVIDEYEDNKGNVCSSGVSGMVDVLTGIFYTNDGTGTFSHGGDIEI